MSGIATQTLNRITFDGKGGATPAERWSVGHRMRDVEVGSGRRAVDARGREPRRPLPRDAGEVDRQDNLRAGAASTATKPRPRVRTPAVVPRHPSTPAHNSPRGLGRIGQHRNQLEVVPVRIVKVERCGRHPREHVGLGGCTSGKPQRGDAGSLEPGGRLQQNVEVGGERDVEAHSLRRASGRARRRRTPSIARDRRPTSEPRRDRARGRSARLLRQLTARRRSRGSSGSSGVPQAQRAPRRR